MSDINKLKPKYFLVSIEKVTPPENMPGDNWHRYIIGQGTSKIDGIRCGTLKEVTLHAEAFIVDLNSRMGTNPGSIYAPRKQNQTAQTTTTSK